MALFKGDPESAASLLARGIEVEFKRLIREKLREAVEPLIEEAAKEAARELVVGVQHWRDMRDMTPQVHVSFNTKPLTPRSP